MAHNHAHHHHQVEGKNLLLSIGLNIIITVAQVTGGLISGSLALLSDALHNFSDVLSLVISYVANKLAKRKSFEGSTFGLKRAELIAAFVNALTLIIVSFYLIYEAATRFIHPVAIEPGLVIWMSLLGIVANGFSVLLLQKDANHNLNMKSAYIHLLTDMMASIAVLAGGLAMKYLSWFWVDSVLTMAIAVYLFFMGLDLLKSSTKMLMLFTPPNIKIEDIATQACTIAGVKSLHHIHLWNLNEEELHLDARLVCTDDITISQFSIILEELKDTLHDKFEITHVTIQPEYPDRLI